VLFGLQIDLARGACGVFSDFEVEKIDFVFEIQLRAAKAAGVVVFDDELMFFFFTHEGLLGSHHLPLSICFKRAHRSGGLGLGISIRNRLLFLFGARWLDLMVRMLVAGFLSEIRSLARGKICPGVQRQDRGRV
jgi:hypothetical protein